MPPRRWQNNNRGNQFNSPQQPQFGSNSVPIQPPPPSFNQGGNRQQRSQQPNSQNQRTGQRQQQRSNQNFQQSYIPPQPQPSFLQQNQSQQSKPHQRNQNKQNQQRNNQSGHQQQRSPNFNNTPSQPQIQNFFSQQQNQQSGFSNFQNNIPPQPQLNIPPQPQPNFLQQQQQQNFSQQRFSQQRSLQPQSQINIPPQPQPNFLQQQQQQQIGFSQSNQFAQQGGPLHGGNKSFSHKTNSFPQNNGIDKSLPTGPMFPNDKKSDKLSLVLENASSEKCFPITKEGIDVGVSSSPPTAQVYDENVALNIQYDPAPNPLECVWLPPCFKCKSSPRDVNGYSPFRCQHKGLCASCVQIEQECALCGEPK